MAVFNTQHTPVGDRRQEGREAGIFTSFFPLYAPVDQKFNHFLGKKLWVKNISMEFYRPKILGSGVILEPRVPILEMYSPVYAN